MNFDTMQYVYQEWSSTTICSWAVTSVINYSNQKGTKVLAAAMDMSKAFDMVEWRELFLTLIDRTLDSLFLYLILFISTNQRCNVRWCGKLSDSFDLQNGVRQGAVTSGIFSQFT